MKIGRILIAITFILNFGFLAGCSGTYGDLDLSEAPETYEELKVEYKDLRAEVQRKKELYQHAKDDFYPEVKRIVTNNWDQYNEDEKQFWTELDEEVKKLDKDLTEFYPKLQKFDEKIRDGSTKLENLYQEYQNLKDTKEDISDTVDKILNKSTDKV